MKILSLNLNDFGGNNDHLFEHKTFNTYLGKECIDWKYWRQCVDKKTTIDKIREKVTSINPDVLIFQEYEINNSPEPMSYLDFLKEEYEIVFNSDIKESATIILIKKEITFSCLPNPNACRKPDHACCISVNNTIVYGIHVPDDQFLSITKKYAGDHKDEDLLIIGDFNVNREKKNLQDTQIFESMLHETGMKDTWLEKCLNGNISRTNETPTYICPQKPEVRNRIDYALTTTSLYNKVKNIDILEGCIEAGLSDHNPILIEI